MKLLGKEKTMTTHKLFFITGASGSGKTTTIKKLEEIDLPDIKYCYFDSIGVPSPEEMIKEFGSGENWQKAKTQEWVQKIQDTMLSKADVVFDGQMRPIFIEEACKACNLASYEVILFDCNDDERKKRLIGRGHADLANEQMMNWARHLRDESSNLGYEILDNSSMTLDESVQALREIIGK
jgi:dephospho-CoA kinase